VAHFSQLLLEFYHGICDADAYSAARLKLSEQIDQVADKYWAGIQEIQHLEEESGAIPILSLDQGGK
jgi:hypothetical protein